MATVRFIPQAWINDYAVEVDPEGPTEFDVPDEKLIGLKPYSYDTDELREHENCPQWAKDWRGPFEIAIPEDLEVPAKCAYGSDT